MTMVVAGLDGEGVTRELFVGVEGEALVALSSDVDAGQLVSGTFTLAVAGTIYPVAIPDWARVVILRPSADARWALGEDPAAEGAGALTAGGTIRAATDHVSVLPSGVGREVRLRSATAGATVYVECRA